jgi:hypothetical protein
VVWREALRGIHQRSRSKSKLRQTSLVLPGEIVTEVLDVREVARRLFAAAKELLQKFGCLAPVGLVLNATGQIEPVDLDGEDKNARRECLRQFRRTGPSMTGVAFFTIRETSYQVFEPLRLPPGLTDKMTGGWIDDGRPHNCLDLRIEVPGQEPTSITVPFRRFPEGVIEFGEQWEGSDDFKGPAPPMCEAEEGLKN